GQRGLAGGGELGGGAGAGRRARGGIPPPAGRGGNAPPPVAQLVAGALHHQRLVVGDLHGGPGLIVEVAEEVLRRGGVELVVVDQPGLRGGRGERAQLADETADQLARLQRTGRRIAVPEGDLPRL